MDNSTYPVETVCQAVRSLRLALGDTQQKFAARLGVAISTAVRYESTRPPRGEAAARLMTLATGSQLPQLAEVFRTALSTQLRHEIVLPGAAPEQPAASGPGNSSDQSAPVTQNVEECGLPPVPQEEAEFEYLKLILRAAAVGLPGFESQLRAWQDFRKPIAQEGVKRTTIRALIEGLYEGVRKRVLAGESDEKILAAASDPERVSRILQKLRRQPQPSDTDRDLVNEMLNELTGVAN